VDRAALVIDQLNAGAELVRRVNEEMPVDAAFWLALPDDVDWYLYVAFREALAGDVATFHSAFMLVDRFVTEMDSPYLDPFRIRVVGRDHFFARAAVEMLRKHPTRSVTRIAGPFGGVYVDGGYLYPPLLPVAAPTA
jgi:hypothetical protein